MPHQTHHLFFSYSRLDNKPQGGSTEGWITAFYKRLQAQHKLYTGRELRIFFDTEEIDDGSDWKARLGQGLRTSNLFLAFLSPNYMRSKNCRWEWEEYLRREHSLARGDDGIRTVFFEIVPGMPGISKLPEKDQERLLVLENELRADQEIARWLNLISEEFRRRNNYFDKTAGMNPRAVFDWRPWFSKGPQILAELDASERLDQLRADPQSDKEKIVDLAERLKSMDEHIAARLDRCLLADLAPGLESLGAIYPHFVGRHKELRNLHYALTSDKAGVVSVVHGLGGQGKTALAIQYAHAYADFYAAGGRWLVKCSGFSSLKEAMERLAIQPTLGFEVPKEIQNDPELTIGFVLLQLKRFMEKNATTIMTKLRGSDARMSSDENLPQLHPRALVILDNVDNPDMVSAQQLRLLRQYEWLELVVTTRLRRSELGNAEDVIPIVVDSLPIEDAVALVRNFQLSPKQEFPSLEYEKGVIRLCKELGGFTLAVEILGAFLSEYPEVSPSDYCDRLIEEGLATAEEVLDYEGVAPNVRHQEPYLSKVIDTTLEKLDERARFVLDHAAILEPDSVIMDWLREIAAKRYPALRHSLEGGSQQFPRDRPDEWAKVWRQLSGLRLLTEGAERPVIKEGEPQSKFVVPAVAKIHRLVAALVQKRLDESTLLQAVKNVAEVFDVKQKELEDVWEHDPSILWVMRPFGDNAIHLARSYPEELSFAIGCCVLSRAELKTGSITNAQRLMETSLPILRLNHEKTENQEASHLLYTALSVRGDFYLERGKPGDAELALGHFQESYELLKSSVGTAPIPGHTLLDLSILQNRLGGFYFRRGEPGDAELALGHFHKTYEFLLKSIAEANSISAKARSELSSTLDRLGVFYLERGEPGDTEMALGHFQKSIDIRRHIAEASPKSVQAQSDLSLSLDRLGVFYVGRGEPGDAELALGHFHKSLDIRRRIVEASPNSAQAQSDLSQSLSRFGDFYFRRGEPGDAELALGHFQKSYELLKSIAEANPNSAQARSNLSASLLDLGVFYLERGRIGDAESALRHFEESLDIRRRIAEANPNSAQERFALSASLDRLGGFYLRRGEPGDAELALGHFQESHRLRKQIADANPNSALALRDLSVSLEKLGSFYLARGRSGDAELALRHLHESHDSLKQIADANPGSAKTLRDLSVSLLKLGVFYLERGKPGDAELALRRLHESYDILKQIANANPGSARALRDLSASLLRLGDLYLERDKSGDAELALRHFQESRDLLKSIADANHNSAEAQRDLVVSLYKLEDFYFRRGKSGDAELALVQFEESHRVLKQIAEANPNSAQALRDLSVSLERMSDVIGQQEKENLSRDALALQIEALQISLKLHEANPSLLFFGKTAATTAIRTFQKAQTAGSSDLAGQCLGVCYSVLQTLRTNGCEFDQWMEQTYQQLHEVLSKQDKTESG